MKDCHEATRVEGNSAATSASGAVVRRSIAAVATVHLDCEGAWQWIIDEECH